jgi:16S rRNA (cytidine1402-2'-O)-methyltransferase
MSGTLFVVATPIGNLEDITFRAVRVLRDVHVIAAEDTRHTAKLLAHYGINTRTISFHDHNLRSRLPQVIKRLEQGENVALVTDAGTPGISDPGIELVDACLNSGIAVDPIPGASAPIAAATASGFRLEPLTIFGFIPTRAKDRNAWMERAREIRHAFTFFEAPHRIQRTLEDVRRILVGRQIFVARELTKMHQQLDRGLPEAVLDRLRETKGEFTIVVGPADSAEKPQYMVADQIIAAEFSYSTENNRIGRRQAIVNLARKYGRSAREVYGIIEKAKASGT